MVTLEGEVDRKGGNGRWKGVHYWSLQANAACLTMFPLFLSFLYCLHTIVVRTTDISFGFRIWRVVSFRLNVIHCFISPLPFFPFLPSLLFSTTYSFLQPFIAFTRLRPPSRLPFYSCISLYRSINLIVTSLFRYDL